MIHHIYGLAAQENDYATQTFVQCFIMEQVEEEKNAGQILEQLCDRVPGSGCVSDG